MRRVVQAAADTAAVRNHANLIWGVAELLRGDYKQADYGKVILPLVVMRRLDQVLEPTRDVVRDRALNLEEQGIENRELALRKVAGRQFFNTHRLRFHQLLDDPGNIAQLLHRYIDGYSQLAREAIDKFDFERHIDRLDRSNLLFQAIGRICQADLHPDKVSNHEMGAIFEELIRRFSEQSNEAAGEHFTSADGRPSLHRRRPRADQARRGQDAAGPGLRYRRHAQRGGESPALAEPGARLQVYGQELNPETYAVCART